MPAESRLDLHTRNDDILVSGVSGNIRLATSNGDLKINGGQGQLHLQTSNAETHNSRVLTDFPISESSSGRTEIFKGMVGENPTILITAESSNSSIALYRG